MTDTYDHLFKLLLVRSRKRKQCELQATDERVPLHSFRWLIAIRDAPVTGNAVAVHPSAIESHARIWNVLSALHASVLQTSGALTLALHPLAASRGHARAALRCPALLLYSALRSATVASARRRSCCASPLATSRATCETRWESISK